MGVCETCGNHHHDTFTVLIHNQTHEFDCLQCAIQVVAPTCTSCSCRILGQVIEENGLYYCGSHCLRIAGQRLYTEELNPMP